MQTKLYFSELDDFLNQNDETTFISDAQTRLVVYFDHDAYDIPEDGLNLNISGNIGDIAVEDFIDWDDAGSKYIRIYDDTEKISIGEGPLINELLNSDDIFLNGAIDYHMILSIDDYSDAFSIIKISDDIQLPRIDLFYSK